MKMTKKIVGVLLALVMALALAVPVLAQQQGTLEGGSITVQNAVEGQTYKIYQILYLESYNQPTSEGEASLPQGQYAYKVNDTWETWIKGNATAYLSIDEQGYATWVENADVAAFAKLAQTFASTLTADGTQTAGAPTEGAATPTVSFSNLKLGYYLVDTSMGTLCLLDTTNPSVIMQEKNQAPTIEKWVQEDSTAEGANGGWVEGNTAEIGQEVKFKTVVHAKAGAQNYVVYDKISDAFTVDFTTVQITVGESTLRAKSGTLTEYSAANPDGYHYEVVLPSAGTEETSASVEIRFVQAYLDTLTADTDITLLYSAVLGKDAAIAPATNDNKAWMTYGNGNRTAEDKTTTLTYAFDLVKTDSGNKLLNGAEFKLYDAQTAGNEIKLVKNTDGSYRLAVTAEEKAADVTIVATNGKATVKGLDANTTYYLEETKQPNGYNKLAGRVAVPIAAANLKATTATEGGVEKWTEGGVQVINHTGTELPSTGGIGTTIFYIVGGILLVGAGVLLVVRKRMSMLKDSEE